MIPAARTGRIAPFYVMEVAKAAVARARSPRPGDREMLLLNIGEPDFTAPPAVVEAATRALREGHTRYTDALGLPALRECISDWYAQRFGVEVPARRIVVTAGASAALQLACLALVEPGAEVLLPDPGYPCNRHFVAACDGVPVALPTHAATRFQPDVNAVAAVWTGATRGLILASPANPTGTSVAPATLGRIAQAVRQRDGFLIVDEIYLGLSHDPAYGQTALALGEDIVSVNSFSKYFCMTGWRLGWLVLPDALLPAVERLAQNLYICPSAIAQHAALACFEPDSLAEYERRRAEFRARRDFFVPALAAAGLPAPVMPDGAFYAWVDCTEACQRLGVADSWALAHALLDRAQIAATPGRDFGEHGMERWLRFSTASSLAQLGEAAHRLRALLG